MTKYKYIYRVTQIVDDEGSLKFIGGYKTDEEVHVGTQIAIIVENNDGKPVKRLYFEVKHVMQFAKLGDVGEISQIKDMASELQVELLVDEPIL